MILGYGYDTTYILTYFICSGGNYTFVMIPGWVSSYPLDINNNGIVAGWGNDGSTTKGFIFDGVEYSFLLPDGWENASVFSINDSNIVVGSGTDSNGIGKAFIGIPLTTAKQIQVIISFYNNGIADSTLYGIGQGKGGEKKLNEFEQMLLQAQWFIENQNISEACQQLKEANSRVDGVNKPSDYVQGPAAPELAAKIDALIRETWGQPPYISLGDQEVPDRRGASFYFDFKNSSTVNPLFLISPLNKPGASSLWSGIESVGFDSW
jgi:hypothetical protein